MEYVTLHTGVQMPMVGYGTWDVRGKEGQKALEKALAVGYRLLDTAKMYDNEEIVGKAVKNSGIKREELFLTTKLHSPYASYEKAKKGIEESLELLQTDYIDLVLVHEPYPQALEMYRALSEAYTEGKVRAIGISNFNQALYEEFIGSCGTLPSVNQVESHVYYPQLSLQKVLQEHGTFMQSWGSFTEGRRPIFTEPTLLELAEKYSRTSGQIALRYLLQNGIGVIPKTVHENRMVENLSVFDFSLTDLDMERIQKLDEKKSLFGWY